MIARLTFQSRLTIAITAIVALAVMLLGAVAFTTVRFALETALETRLDTTVKAIRSIVDVRHHRMEDLHNEDLVQFQALLGGGLNAAVLRRNGSLMTSNLASPPLSVLATMPARAKVGEVVRVDRGPVAYNIFPIDEAGTYYGTIVAWESRDADRAAERITLMALGAAGLLVIAAAAVTGGMLSRRLLQPVTELSAMIADIETTNLTERLAWSGPDDELSRLCATFDRLLDRLETAFERERRFIADASHELRTPLSVMRAEVELALMHERSPEAYRSALVRLQRETQRLEALAQSLILTARDETTVTHEVSAGEIAERASMRMRPLATARNLTITCDAQAAAVVNGDPDALERAVVALIDNALRFAKDAVRVSVTDDAEHVRIAVADDGPGFSETALAEATNRFWRDDPARSGEGTGLGLAIARSIAERHRGTIELSNGPGGAEAVVVLTLPLS